MAAGTLFRRHSNVSCFFCQSNLPIPQNPRSFRCTQCGCWNRYDVNGEILSDEPAMHDEALNARSFAKRASPRKDRLPTTYGNGPFCRNCQTNQMLLMNLLSNYLPSPEDPEYAGRLERLPEYRESLHTRYPPVCASCLPQVEEEIRKKDNMARTKALGGWLRESKGKEKQRRHISGPHKEIESIGAEMVAWRIRGCLWVATLTLALAGNSTAALGYRPLHRLGALQPILPVITLISILWTVWDPLYSSARKAKIQGRDVRVKGKHKYIGLQLLSWLSRLTTSTLLAILWFRPHLDYINLSYEPPSLRSRIYFASSFIIELLTFIFSCVVLRLQQPPAIRLIDTNTHITSRNSTPFPSIPSSSPPPPSVAEPDLIASLTLSNKPVIIPSNSNPNPIFGHPSLLSAVPPPPPSPPSDRMDEDEDEDAMDWTPTNPSPKKKTNTNKNNTVRPKTHDDDGSWLRPQRFFAPEHPTGLEGLFERTRLVDDSMDGGGQRRGVGRGRGTRGREMGAHVWNWWWVYCLSLIPVVGAAIVYKVWFERRRY